MSLSRAPARDTSETPSPRERIRSHMKMVISQLEGILIELKDVAKELREVSFKVYTYGGLWEAQGATGWLGGGRTGVGFSTRLLLINCFFFSSLH